MASTMDTAETRRIDWLGSFKRLRDRLSASDPAFSRLRMASRALLSLALSVAVLAAISVLVHPLPFAAFGLSFVISFNGTLAVRDNGARAQAVTRALAWVATLTAVSAATLLANWPAAADAAFLATVFTAVYVRRLGPRWTAVGMIGFMAFFMGDYLRPGPADLFWLAGATAIAFAIAQLTTNVVLRDDPERDFRRALVSLDQRITLILRQLAVPPVDRAGMQAQLSRLRDVVMMAEGFIPQGEDGSLAARGTASDLAIALFDLQLAVEQLARVSYGAPPPAAQVNAALAGRPVPAESDDRATLLLGRTMRARAQLRSALEALPSPFARKAAGGAPKPAAAAKPVGAGLVPVELQLPIQVTLACAIAMAAGLLVSPSRWYWAVITAFLVFNNTKSRADTAMRGLQRSFGTFLGLIGGTVIATLLHGQPVLAGALMPVCFFLAFYYLQVSYSVMVFFITLALALLYGLTGSFSPEVLELRLAETAVGSLAGTLVAFLVFPARTAAGVGAALDRYLKALGDVVAAARGRAFGEPEPLHLLARSRLLDRAYTELAAAARPIGGRWGAVTRFGEVRERLLLLSGIVHWARVLARSLPLGGSVTEAERRRIGEGSDEIARRIALAMAREASFFDRPEGSAAEALQPRPPVPVGAKPDPMLALEVIAALLARVTPAEKPKA